MDITLLDLENIQGYLIRGYAHMLYSRFVYIKIVDPKAAKMWLSNSWKVMTTAERIHDKSKIPPTHLNISFTHDGLGALGLDEENLGSFSREFRQGMVSPHRSRLLGDLDKSSPDQWIWGAKSHEGIDLCLMVFGNDKSSKYDLAKDKIVCINYYHELAAQFAENGLKELFHIDGQTQPDNKEHFGFRDGISQPIIEGSGRVGNKDDVIKAGEFLFGYKNEFDVYPDTPLLVKEQGNVNLLSTDAGGSGQKDIGKDGTFMVMRQLEQDVTKFWDFMNENSRNPDGSINEAESLKLGAKFIGRWQNGAPITLFPESDPGPNSDINDFGYAKFDEDGLKCPFGSHLRRQNPRDSVDNHNRHISLKLSKQHRIIRRARLYGEIYEGSPTNTRPSGEVGLLFICFNADISRQFEFLQYTWANLPKNKELYSDPDPIIGVKENPSSEEEQNFTVQDLPVNRTVKGMPRVISVKGGAYFFLPSINVLRYLSTI